MFSSHPYCTTKMRLKKIKWNHRLKRPLWYAVSADQPCMRISYHSTDQLRLVLHLVLMGKIALYSSTCYIRFVQLLYRSIWSIKSSGTTNSLSNPPFFDPQNYAELMMKHEQSHSGNVFLLWPRFSICRPDSELSVNILNWIYVKIWNGFML